MVIISKNPSQTKKAGKILARAIKRTPIVFSLTGKFGAGKTTFLQGFAKGLGIKEKILSPSFVIMKEFNTPKKRVFYHFDCYRIKSPKHILSLKFKDIVSDSKSIVVIEWGEKIKRILPLNTLVLKFEIIDKNKRGIWIKNSL